MTLDDLVLRAVEEDATTQWAIFWRVADRFPTTISAVANALQRLRKRGLIRYAGGKWTACERLEKERGE